MLNRWIRWKACIYCAFMSEPLRLMIKNGTPVHYVDWEVKERGGGKKEGVGKGKGRSRWDRGRGTQKEIDKKILTENFFQPKIFFNQNYFFRPTIFLDKIFFFNQIFFPSNFFLQNFFLTKIFFDQKFFGGPEYNWPIVSKCRLLYTRHIKTLNENEEKNAIAYLMGAYCDTLLVIWMYIIVYP